MGYYIGTEQECKDYNNLVVANENYNGTTTNWSDILQNNSNPNEYAVFVNTKYSSSMDYIERLPDTWYE